MVGLSVCPRCQSHVTPLRGPDGRALCPACNNTGVIQQAQPVWGTPAAPPLVYVQPANADGAVLALVMGILALVLPYIGFIFAFIGLSAAKRAMAAVTASGGRLGGQGMAKAGQVMSIISLCVYGIALVIVLSAVVFVLVSDLGKSPAPDLILLASGLS